MTPGVEVHRTREFGELSQEALLDSIRRSPIVMLVAERTVPKSDRQVFLDHLVFGPLVVACFFYLPVFGVVAATIGYFYRPAMTTALVLAVAASLLKALSSPIRGLKDFRKSMDRMRRHAGRKELYLDLIHRRLVCCEKFSSSGEQRTETVPLSLVQFVKVYDEHPNPAATDDLKPDSFKIKVQYSLMDIATPWAREMLDKPIRVYDFSRGLEGHKDLFDRQAIAVIDALTCRTRLAARAP
jgi:hypothetical protein